MPVATLTEPKPREQSIPRAAAAAWLIKTLEDWDRRGAWGTIEVVVQSGKVQVVKRSETFKGSIPQGE